MSVYPNRMDIKTMSLITQKLDAFLKAEGFYMLEAGRSEGFDSIKVNKLEYMREDGENVFIFTHEPKEKNGTDI